MDVATLSAAAADAAPPTRGALLLCVAPAVRPRSPSPLPHLQAGAARAAGAALVTLNEDLRVPSPVAAGRTTRPMPGPC